MSLLALYQTLSLGTYLPLGQYSTTSSNSQVDRLGLDPAHIPSVFPGTTPCPVSHRPCGNTVRPGIGACVRSRPSAVPDWLPKYPSQSPSLPRTHGEHHATQHSFSGSNSPLLITPSTKPLLAQCPDTPPSLLGRRTIIDQVIASSMVPSLTSPVLVSPQAPTFSSLDPSRA